MRSEILEVEVDTATDGNLWFTPLQRTIRGKLDFVRLAHRLPDAIKLTMDYPKGVPGQRLRIDLTNNRCSIVEPLHTAEWESTRARIEKKAGAKITGDEDCSVANVADWLHEIRRCIQAGHVRVVAGKLPDDLGVETPAKVSQDPSEQQIDRLCGLVEKLLERLAK